MKQVHINPSVTNRMEFFAESIIKDGFLGDVVIFNNDLMTIPHDQIMSSKVDYTIVGGKVLYKRKETN